LGHSATKKKFLFNKCFLFVVYHPGLLQSYKYSSSHRTKGFSLTHSQNLAKYIQNCTEQDDYEVGNINCSGPGTAANLW